MFSVQIEKKKKKKKKGSQQETDKYNLITLLE